MAPSGTGFFTPNTDYVSDFVLEKAEEDKRLNFLTAEGGVKLGGSWELGCKLWYDIHHANLRETDISAKYISQCWGLTAQYTDRPKGHQIMVMLDLKGLGNVKL